jgi:glycosyltransferase involved in cell wall biosynthesis
VIRNAVDLQRFNPRAKDRDLMRRWQVTADDIVVAHISNLKSLKRPVDLVDSATLALQRDARLLYFVIGDGSERQRMEEACRTRNLSERFRFVGWIDQDAIPAYINLADIVVLPSENEPKRGYILKRKLASA